MGKDNTARRVFRVTATHSPGERVIHFLRTASCGAGKLTLMRHIHSRHPSRLSVSEAAHITLGIEKDGLEERGQTLWLFRHLIRVLASTESVEITRRCRTKS